MDDPADGNALRLRERVHERVQRRRVEGASRREPLFDAAQELRGTVLPHPLVERVLVVRELVVGQEERRVAQDVSGDLDPVTGRLEHPRQRVGHVRRDRRGHEARALQVRQHERDLLLDRHGAHIPILERPQLQRVEAGRRPVHPLQREMLDHLFTRERFGPIIQRPAQEQQVVEDRVGQVAHLPIEVDGHRRKGRRRRIATTRLGNLDAVVIELLEIHMLERLLDLALAQLLGAARLGHIGHVSVVRHVVSKRPSDEDLPGRVGEMLHGADDVGDPKIVVIDRARQGVQERPVGPLDDVVLLQRPLEPDVATNEVPEGTRAFPGHLQPHAGRATLGLEPAGLLVGLGQPAAAVEKAALLPLGDLPLGLDFLRPGIVTVGHPVFEQTPHGVSIPVRAL